MLKYNKDQRNKAFIALMKFLISKSENPFTFKRYASTYLVRILDDDTYEKVLELFDAHERQ